MSAASAVVSPAATSAFASGYLGGTWSWLTDPVHWNGEDGVWHRLLEHLAYSGVCLGLALLIALPAGIVLGHLGRFGALAVNIANAGRAVPTLALMSVLVLTPLGNRSDYWPLVISLTLFCLPPILANAYVGMREVDRDVVEAARGLGMTGAQLVFRVELPLARPLVMTGIRAGAVQLVATATLAALVGGGGLGRIITQGFALQSTPQVVAGAVLVAVLALAVEAVFWLAERALDPRPERRPARRRDRRERRDRTDRSHEVAFDDRVP